MLEASLRCMTGKLPSRWGKWLSLAEWWYNSSYHSSLKLSPFEALYGYKPFTLPMGPYLDAIIPAASTVIQNRAQMLQVIKEHLAQAQNRMKMFADRNRTKRQFTVGEWVFLKLQP